MHEVYLICNEMYDISIYVPCSPYMDLQMGRWCGFPPLLVPWRARGFLGHDIRCIHKTFLALCSAGLLHPEFCQAVRLASFRASSAAGAYSVATGHCKDLGCMTWLCFG